MPKEICPTCAERGDKSPKDVEVTSEEGKETKEFSCGHKQVTVTIDETGMLKDLANVNPKSAKEIVAKRDLVNALLGTKYGVKKEEGEK